MQLRCARDRNNPRLLGKQPCKRNLSGCRVLAVCDLAKQINHGLVGLERLGRKARNDVAEIGLVERRVLVDISRNEALPQSTKWTKADAGFLDGQYHYYFRLSH